MKYLALSGGVGGAKLAEGLAQILPPESLVVAVNVGDDFEQLGLTICPDLDTVLYTLARCTHPHQGWGRADETWHVRDEIQRLGGETWFALGDRDIALHLLRRELLDRGCTLSEVTMHLAERFNVAASITPITDQMLRTVVETDRGTLAFQDYFVRLHCEPTVRSLHFAGAQRATLAPLVRATFEHKDLAGVILCPSNPYLSIAPMLAISELRKRLGALDAPVIAVSPIVAGRSVKGPTAKIMRELQVEPAATVVADLYEEFVDVVIVDTADAALVAHDERFAVTNTMMKTVEQKAALARYCVELIGSMRSRTAS